ncbi:hypothetical protein, partial [Methylovulum psychrotolerans]|uniref:hypothetical protein n=1 Tax=Methylovulum psychrotolerans TaxID=1704499 RepID=UPI0014741096
TSIEVNHSNNLFEDITSFLGINDEESSDIGSFLIIMKPLRRRNIKPAVQKLIDTTNENGIEKLIIKAKDEISGHMIDLYLSEKGAISDNITTRDESLIYEQLITKAKENANLFDKVKEFTDDGELKKNNITDINTFCDSAAWANFI